MESIAYLKNAAIYQQDMLILQQANLSISRSEFVYLIGKTGSGKSSVLKTLWGELPLREGEGRVGEYALNALTSKDIPGLRRSIGVVFQDFRLFRDWSVLDNLLFVLEATGWSNPTEARRRAEKVLTDVGILAKIKEPVSKLSGGEQQRVVIARSILNNPILIIADEPTGNLDPDTSDEILHLMRRLAMEYRTAMLMATHDFRIIRKFPGRVYQCEDGTLEEVEEG